MHQRSISMQWGFLSESKGWGKLFFHIRIVKEVIISSILLLPPALTEQGGNFVQRFKPISKAMNYNHSPLYKTNNASAQQNAV